MDWLYCDRGIDGQGILGQRDKWTDCTGTDEYMDWLYWERGIHGLVILGQRDKWTGYTET